MRKPVILLVIAASLLGTGCCRRIRRMLITVEVESSAGFGVSPPSQDQRSATEAEALNALPAPQVSRSRS